MKLQQINIGQEYYILTTKYVVTSIDYTDKVQPVRLETKEANASFYGWIKTETVKLLSLTPYSMEYNKAVGFTDTPTGLITVTNEDIATIEVLHDALFHIVRGDEDIISPKDIDEKTFFNDIRDFVKRMAMAIDNIKE